MNLSKTVFWIVVNCCHFYAEFSWNTMISCFARQRVILSYQINDEELISVPLSNRRFAAGTVWDFPKCFYWICWMQWQILFTNWKYCCTQTYYLLCETEMILQRQEYIVNREDLWIDPNSWFSDLSDSLISMKVRIRLWKTPFYHYF